jgi:hypothetical protein
MHVASTPVFRIKFSLTCFSAIFRCFALVGSSFLWNVATFSDPTGRETQKAGQWGPTDLCSPWNWPIVHLPTVERKSDDQRRFWDLDCVCLRRRPSSWRQCPDRAGKRFLWGKLQLDTSFFSSFSTLDTFAKRYMVADCRSASWP